MFIKLAWRNVFRNKRRTFIAGTAIGLGLASIMFVDAMMIGWIDALMETATSTFMGDGQIHAKNFRLTREVEDTIVNLAQVEESLRTEETVDKFSVRAMSFGMVTSPANVRAAAVIGVNPDDEKYLSKIDDVMVEGDYFEGNKPRDVLVGRRMAELLEAELGDRLVITVAQAKSGDLSQEMFRISGIFDTGSKEMDEGMVFIRLGKAQKMLAIGKNAHQIAIKLKDTSLSRDESFDLWQRYSKDGNEAASWLTLMPQLKATLGMVDFSMAITVLIVFGLVALVIVNTIFMSLYERMFEFGVMRALGTGSVEIVKLIIFESGALATVSIALGTILGAGVNYLFSIVGFDYSGIEMSGITFEIIYTVIDIRQFVLYPALLFAFTLLVGIYPAVYAAKMKAIEAMRKSI